MSFHVLHHSEENGVDYHNCFVDIDDVVRQPHPDRLAGTLFAGLFPTEASPRHRVRVVDAMGPMALDSSVFRADARHGTS